jgi:hypothetical protein
MPQHEIEMSLPAQTVNNTDVEVSVWSDGNKLGSLKISKGTIDWMPSPNSKTHFKMSWERFDEVMKEKGRETT